MQVFVTGAGGFIGGSVVRRLIARGDRVVAMVREPDRATALHEVGVDLRRGDLTRIPAIVDAMRGADAAIHLAGDYRVGIPAQERTGMLDTNLGGTTRVVEASRTARLERLVYISTVNVFGDTHGRIVDEGYRRDLAEGFLSAYDESKFLAHRAVEEQIAAGAPVVIAMPGGTYGPGDHSAVGAQLRGAHDGTLRYRSIDDTGLSFAHVDDVAAGIVAALDRGRIGEAYVVAGESTRLADAMEIAARLAGRSLPRLRVPGGMLRLLASLPASVRESMDLPSDLHEVIRAAAGVTYWASSAKASAEIGYAPRDLASGLRATFADA
jgi:dihydroflavonol-4-reductase